jgi:dCMP deaminase
LGIDFGFNLCLAGMFKPTAFCSMKKREGYISWDEYFMGIALLSARRSKDPSTQVGACIVNDKNKIVGAGYNGLPIGCHDDDFPWGKEGQFLDTKYPYVCHAELNAILNNIGIDLQGCKIYTALFPCNECCKAIIQAGIKEVIYLSDKYAHTDIFKASRRMLDTAGVTYRKVETTITSLVLSYQQEDV